MAETPCSTGSVMAGEPLIGSAPDAVAWVCLEQKGPWGAKAWTDSHLDPDLGAAIEAAAAPHRVRPSLIRRPGKHADPAPGLHDGPHDQRHVLVAHTHPQNSWLLTGRIDAPADLLALDWAAVAAGDLEAVRASLPVLAPSSDPVLLVCTNGTRDTCCARLGRPVALTTARSEPDHVWEVTHTSGHRFAPTTVLLPSGILHGRVLDGSVLLADARAGRVTLTGYRGRSTWSVGAQVAEEHIRRTEGVLGLDDLEVVPEVDAWTVHHRDGRRWWVAVSSTESGERPESCGKDDKPVRRFEARTVRGPAT